MPKDSRANSSSFDRAMVSPYGCSLNNSDRNNHDSSSPPFGDEGDWEEARCPICIEHPHNAVLLLCSSKDKGCRPFMCDTSYRHSNCLDQFCKSSATSPPEEQQSDLLCPLCRGHVTGWVVIEPTRRFMNSKTRNCSLETCGFSGNYTELRKHARMEHPSRRPSVASPTRQSNWAVQEQQRDIEDALAHQSDMEYDLDGWPGLGEWGEDDMWSDGSFFDLQFGMSDNEDDLMFSPSVLSIPFITLSPSSSELEMMDFGSSESSDISTSSLSRLVNHEQNALPSSSSRSTFHSENGPTVRRTMTNHLRSMPDQLSENNVVNLGSRSNNSSSRSNYHRENISTNSRSNHSSSRSIHRRENSSTTSRSRSNYHRENAPTSSRTRSSYRRDNGSTSSRSSYHRENAGSGSRTRSNYHNRGDDHPSSRPR